MNYPIDYFGVCPICEKNSNFRSQSDWARDFLICTSCDNTSIPRERALARALKLFAPQWRELTIHECSPNDSGISRKLRLECPGYIPTQYFNHVKQGDYEGIYRSENLENLSFESNKFDLFISLDVFEHLFSPEAAIKEIWRTLKPGGHMISTWPIRKYQSSAIEFRAILNPDGSVTHIKEPEVHGNPIDGSGSLVTVDYGYDIHLLLAQWAHFDVTIMRFADRTHGILGEYTDTIICRKLVQSE